MFWPFAAPYPQQKAAVVNAKTYDYIIVGGGTAACVLASRLSEDPTVTVLLISKGKVSDGWLHSIPLVGNARDGAGSDIDTLWSEPNDQWPKHKVRTFTSQSLGGATTVNGLMYTRAAPSLYNHWAALGNDQWSFEKCEPYFKKFENSHSRPGAPYRGHNGPVDITARPHLFAVDDYFEEAARDLNIPIGDDVNDPRAPAAGIFTVEAMITKLGSRHSAYTAFLPKSLVLDRRERLTICAGAIATRLQTNQDGTEATGVYILDHLTKSPGKECLVRAEREVIVSCGALFSPQLLMLSGIGPRQHIQEHKIPLLRDLPGVGIVSDHVAFNMSFELRLVDSFLRMMNPFVAIWMLLVYIFAKTGMLATAGARLSVWLNSRTIDEETMTLKLSTDARGHDDLDASLPENIPDIELLYANAAFDAERGKGYGMWQAVIAQPFSRGRVELASTDPLAPPKYFSQYITDERDWIVARKAARFTMNYIERFRQTKYPFNSVWHSGPGVKRGTVEGSWKDLSDAQVDAYIKEKLINHYHSTSSCRMAPQDDGGVVGQDLRVHGFRNLRVVDASVFPVISSHHPVATIYMIAERCADFIKNDWA
ncbi:L-sorbose 1-dehydrogenase [Colletotrichum orbiculare MAFF 240422]|uniref:L-sorbose 1-dehydrogenase n=1 Tax=Colletotrichum orbiculare (strain 104-T / ATCC 96160 / CBS 514.97 / LARS 414 / MAFF 240422) TaxID=1213857 RepID=N4V7N6_COLOR|nr:L-sorbose 1-dehydrogenase [Colletotrichum orbiculare MAFF 240422]